jgi:hypothetical protein
METLTVHLRLDEQIIGRCWQASPTFAGKRGARFIVIALAAYYSGRAAPHPPRAHSTPDSRSPSPMVVAPVLLILAASQVHGPGESGRASRDRDPVARHADVETAAIPIELDFDRVRAAT